MKLIIVLNIMKNVVIMFKRYDNAIVGYKIFDNFANFKF